MAAHLDRLRGEFITHVSHEMRTPLTLILGYVSHISAVLVETLDHLEIVQRRANMMADIVAEMVGLAEAGSPTVERKFKRVDLVPLVTQVYADFLPKAAKVGLDFGFIDQIGTAVVRGHERLVIQMVDDLVSNAIKFTPAGTVTVSVSECDDCFCVSVADTGVGIEYDVLPMIFDPFFFQGDGSDKRQFEGIGLGLHFVRSAAVAHRAYVDVDSVEGEGSTFTIYFPKPSEKDDG